MDKLIYFNTVINVLLVGWWLYRNNRLYISASRTSKGKTFTGIEVWLRDSPERHTCGSIRILYIPIRNYEKIETREDVMRLINSSHQNRTQVLNTIFSWLKTDGEVLKFRKDYSVVDERLVINLVREFNPKL